MFIYFRSVFLQIYFQMTEFYGGRIKVNFPCFGNDKMAAMTSNVNFESYILYLLFRAS